jgi:adenylate cyclase
MGQVIEHNGGIVDKFIGDAIMALWGAPICHEDDVDRALCAAIEMSNELAGLNELLQVTEWPAIQIGIGIHTGVVVAGNMGSPDRLNYTVIGDGVNLASRLETLTKEYDAMIIISEASLSKAKLEYETQDLGIVKVKGRSEETRIFALLGKRNT